ncbi:MAG: glycine betaine ABC transporter substrate-binding protein [Acidimicrobiales bacterium]
MRLPGTRWWGWATVIAVIATALASCSSSSKTTTTNGVCAAKPGQTLAVLADDKHLEASDNIIPIINTKVAKAPLTTALNSITAALSQTALIQLNVQTGVDKTDPATVASQFVSSHNLGQGLSGGSGSITIAAQGFAENETLADIAADVLNKAGYNASAKVVGERELYEPALESDQVQAVMDYAASLTTYLATKVKSTEQPSSSIDTTVSVLKNLATPRGLTVLNAASATDENAYAVTSATAKAYGLKSLSDLASKCGGGITLGGPANCPTRPECQIGLMSTYGLKIKSFDALDEDGPLTRTALKSGKILLGVVFSSDSDATPA